MSKGRARRGKAFRVKALVMQKELRGRGLAAEAMKRLQEELGWVHVAGSDYKLTWWSTWLPAWRRRTWVPMPGKAGLVGMESRSGIRGHL